MKWYFSLLLMAFVNLGFAQNASGVKVEFDSYTHDFGVINEANGVVAHTFKYRNVGTDPYVITEVGASCGCTSPTYSRQPLLSDKSEEFTIRFDPSDRPGRFDKIIQIVSNQGITRLTIYGIVTPRPQTVADDFPYLLSSAVRASNLLLRVDAVPRGRAITRTVEIANTSIAVPATVEIQTATLPNWLSASISSTVVAASARTAITLTIKSDSLWGKHSATVGIKVNGALQAEKIHVTASFVDDFSTLTRAALKAAPRADFSSYFYHFSNQKNGTVVTRDFRIKNSGSLPLYIRHIESSSTTLKWKIDKQKIEAEEVATLHLTLSIDQAGSISESIYIICSDPNSPIREIRLLANGTS